jgi:hypothetical protein
MLDATHLEAVPGGLEKLTLKVRSLSRKHLPIPCSALCNLPKNLRKLDLSAPTISLDPEPKDYSCIVWPVHLRCLRLVNISKPILQNLPPHVEDLKLWIARMSDESDDEEFFPTHLLPSTLTSLDVSFLNSYKKKFTLTRWPPSLKNCKIPFDFNQSTREAWSQVPHSMTMIDLGIDYPYKDKIADDVPNLKRIPVAWSGRAFPASLLSHLPPNLTDFFNSHNSVGQIPAIPQSIRSMVIKIRPGSACVQSSADEMNTPSFNSSVCDIMRLPRNLTNLTLYRTAIDAKLCYSDFECLPPTLQNLMFELQHLENSEVLSVIPRSLKTITITISPTTEDSLISDVALLDHLPTSLTSITLYMHRADIAWPEWMCRMNRFTSMRTICLECWLQPQSRITINPPLDFLRLLPQTLTELALPLFQVDISPEQVKNAWPKRLTDLSLRSIAGSMSTASNDCFIGLPTSLVRLELPSNLKGLTDDFFRIIPTSVVSLSAPANIAQHIHLLYDREPAWTCFRPV